MTQLRLDINTNEINGISDTDLAIWATPEGTAYVDGTLMILQMLTRLTHWPSLVLSNKKVDEPVKKGKGYKDAQWEAEVRKSLANKKTAGPATLSKQEQALVQAQLEKEAAIRAWVNTIKSRLQRGLQLVRSLAAARVELHAHISAIIDLLLGGAFNKRAVTLVGFVPFETYMVGAQSDYSKRFWHAITLSGPRLMLFGTARIVQTMDRSCNTAQSGSRRSS